MGQLVINMLDIIRKNSYISLEMNSVFKVKAAILKLFSERNFGLFFPKKYSETWHGLKGFITFHHY